MRRENERFQHRGFGIGIIIAPMVFTLCFAAGYIIADFLYSVTGRPADIWAHIISGLLGIMIFFLGMKILTGLYNLKHRYKGTQDKMRNVFLSNTIEAMERISRGDFNVLLQVDEYNPFSELTESVNRMAKELGTMEKLRQDFISNVSHEIQSPLTSISGFAALLKNEKLSPAQKEHYIDIIETEAKRLSKLSDNLLKLSALENNTQPLTITEYSLNKQIQNAVLMLEPQWNKKNLELSLSLDEISYQGDEGLLSQVWINLIHNAIKFTQESGKINVSLIREEEKVLCRVADTGAGFSEEDGMHIFERFYKADKARDRSLGGNGLGLSLVKKIVELHGGTITAESQKGVGSVFNVMLPLNPKK